MSLERCPHCNRRKPMPVDSIRYTSGDASDICGGGAACQPALLAEVKELQLLRERARTYQGFEAWACPLCYYEKGYYLGPCTLHAKIKELEDGIRKHRDAAGHDRCHLDDDDLYALLPEGNEGADRTLPPEDEFITGCRRFWERRKTGVSFEHCSLVTVMDERDAALAKVAEFAEAMKVTTPSRMALFCPQCKARHVDEGEWTVIRHRTHLCGHCGHKWRPFLFNTIGVSDE